MIYIPMPNAWPVCAQCKKPVERLTELVLRIDPKTPRFVGIVECHGDRERVEFVGFGEVRRVHFTLGTEVFLPKQDGIGPIKRSIDL